MTTNTKLGQDMIDAIEGFDVFTEKFSGYAKQSATLSVDVFDKAVDNVLELQGELAKSTNVAWFTDVAESNQKLVKTLTDTVTGTARTYLK
ncbi:hypothetical protein [Tomitella biformata]|uniref:hypothetical protein n=1 Tax=Tomitella biformata TaxID=630403 RepID=UPI000467CED8|nr:hypothetical protein [Tomitella biformata]